MRSLAICIYAKTKTQISFAVTISFSVTAKLISAFAFPTRIVQSLCRNFKPPAFSSCCTARFVSDLVGSPEDRFSCDEAHQVLIRTYLGVTKVSAHNIVLKIAAVSRGATKRYNEMASKSNDAFSRIVACQTWICLSQTFNHSLFCEKNLCCKC